MHYDYLVVGAGLFGAVFAHEMTKKGKKCLKEKKEEWSTFSNGINQVIGGVLFEC